MPRISIVTCTRSPDPALLSRVLAAVRRLTVPEGWTREYRLIDSASPEPLERVSVVAEFLAGLTASVSASERASTAAGAMWAKVHRTEEPGLSAARRLAVQEATGELLVWFDDDNVPEPDYLTHVVSTALAHTEVGAWGAGRIAVEFTGPVADWVEREMRPFFQERRHTRDEFGMSTTWAPFFPVGSGLVTRRATIARWADATARGTYTLTGRSGTQLSAGDDAQIIFGAVAAGERVGVVAGQALTHLIPPTRCTEDYLARLEFGLSASLRVARAECFPAARLGAAEDLGLVEAVRAALKARRVHGDDGARFARFELARRLGALAGTLRTQSRAEPWWLRSAISALRLR
ncbi:MAG: glycosyltransferase [Gemmatimonadaceae bacterium]